MSLSSSRKRFNKANQKVEAICELICALIAATHEYLQPNPATRAKLATIGTLSEVRGTAKILPYPQTEGLLADTMQKYGTALGVDSNLGKALIEASEAYRQMADIKYQVEGNVEHNLLDPLPHLQQTDLKEANELIQMKEKLEGSKQVAEKAMHNLLSNDMGQVSQLCALIRAQLGFHQQTTEVLERLQQHCAKGERHEQSTSNGTHR